MSNRSRNNKHTALIVTRTTRFVVTLISTLTMVSLDSNAFESSILYVPNEAHNDIYIEENQLVILESESKLMCLMLCDYNDQCQSISYNYLSMACLLFTVTFRGRQNVIGTNQNGWRHLVPFTRDCEELYKENVTTGIYTIFPGNYPSFMAKCEMDVDGGRWTVIQQRVNGTVGFNRTWIEYKNGFGDLTGEFWLGNDRIHAITTSAAYELRIDVSAWTGNSFYAVYKKFNVGDEHSQYELTVETYSGNGGDGMSWHSGMKFSTMDRDNDITDGHCSKYWGGNGGWWYRDCDNANLNGLYGENVDADMGVEWDTAMGPSVTMNSTRMMIRLL